MCLEGSNDSDENDVVGVPLVGTEVSEETTEGSEEKTVDSVADAWVVSSKYSQSVAPWVRTSQTRTKDLEDDDAMLSVVSAPCPCPGFSPCPCSSNFHKDEWASYLGGLPALKGMEEKGGEEVRYAKVVDKDDRFCEQKI